MNEYMTKAAALNAVKGSDSITISKIVQSVNVSLHRNISQIGTTKISCRMNRPQLCAPTTK